MQQKSMKSTCKFKIHWYIPYNIPLHSEKTSMFCESARRAGDHQQDFILSVYPLQQPGPTPFPSPQSMRKSSVWFHSHQPVPGVTHCMRGFSEINISCASSRFILPVSLTFCCGRQNPSDRMLKKMYESLCKSHGTSPIPCHAARPQHTTRRSNH